MMYSKYQIIKILENCFQNMNCFSWIKLIFVPIHLKYWCYNSAHLELHYLTVSVKLYPSQLKPVFSTILIVLFIGLPIFSYPIQPYTTTDIEYIKPYAKPSQSNASSSYMQIIISYRSSTSRIKNWVFKDFFSFKV